MASEANATRKPAGRIYQVATLVGARGRNCSHLQGLRLWAGDSVALDARSDGNSLPIKQPTQACRKHQWLAGDAFTVDFGIEFEAVLLTNLLHHFSKSECERILRRIYECLNPGGRLFIREFVPNADRVTPPIPAVIQFNDAGTDSRRGTRTRWKSSTACWSTPVSHRAS